MLRRSVLVCDSFKEHYQRVHLPRRVALQRYVRNQERLQQKGKAAAAAAATATAGAAPNSGEVPYRYNRWWSSNDYEFVHQYAFVEDPDVTRQKRETIPAVTKDNIWKEPQKTFFMPFAPYIRVVDYPKDPDSKFLKPVNIPRWKDYMQRTKPVVPRVWY